MWARAAVRSLVIVLVVSLMGCGASDESDPTSPFAAEFEFRRSLDAGPAVFVLDHVESQSAAPIVTFDHICSGRRFQDRVYDTVTVWADGRAQRGLTYETMSNGEVRSRMHITYAGKWSNLEGLHYYYSDGTSLVFDLDLTSGEGPPYELLLRIRDARALTAFRGLGGSCPGSPNDERSAEFTYSRN